MIIWNIKKQKDRLKSEGLSQKNLFIYIFIYIVLSTIILELLSYVPFPAVNFYDYIDSGISLIVITLGTYLIYLANGGSKGRNFAENFFSIGFVVGIRFIVLLIPIIVALSVIWINEPIENELSTTWYEVLVFQIWTVALYWRMIVHVKEVAEDART